MDLSCCLDSTTLFVILVLAALGILWAYVTIGGKQEQPNLTPLLYESPSGGPKASSGKKASKGKAKKQGDASPRATHKSREAKPESKPEITTTTNAPVRKRKTVNESVKAAQGSKVKGRKIQIVSKPEVEVEKEKSEGNEGTGEWQTQLSRQQIRAQRQKKQQTAESPVPSEPISRGNEGEEEGSKVASGEKTTSYSKGGRRGKAKKQTDVSKSREPVKDTNSKATAEQTTPPTSEAGPSGEERISPPPEASKVQELTEVEKALLEAAETSPSPEHGDGQLAEVKPKKQKKSKLKDTARASPSPEFSTKDHDDDWVEVIKK